MEVYMVSEVMSQIVENSGAAQTVKKEKKTESSEYGRTIGAPRLSEEGKKYYEQLKKKYSNMDFILVSKDMKEQAKANAAQYANPVKMVVLIDEEKIERMATDENYRKQYESIISGATNQLSKMKEGLGDNASSVKGFGMQIDDGGTATYFAVIDKSLAAQRERIAKKAEQKAEAKKKAAKEAREERIEEQRAKRKEEKATAADRLKENDSGDDIIITANSIEELLQKINDAIYYGMSDVVQTDTEKMIGQNIDFRG